MGRASNRKLARRQAAHSTRPATPAFQAEAAKQLQLVVSLRALGQAFQEHNDRYTEACRAWCGGREPVPAEAPRWPEGSLGRRLSSRPFLAQARNAPSLLTADVPDATVIAAKPAHWYVAVSALVRAVVFDGLEVRHPAVSTLLDALAPVAKAELGHGEAIRAWLHGGRRGRANHRPEFPLLDGPVFLLGTGALVDVTWAVAGHNPVSEVPAVLRSAVDGAIPGAAGQVVAAALIVAMATHYCHEPSGIASVLRGSARSPGGNPLETLIVARAVPPGDVLRAGLAVLSALAGLCENGSASVPGRSPEQGAA